MWLIHGFGNTLIRWSEGDSIAVKSLVSILMLSNSKINLSINKLKYDLFIKKYICLNDDPNHKLIEDAILSDHMIKMK